MQAKQAVGSGFPVLINSLKTERGDLEMMRGILESLALATQPDERSARMQVKLPKQSQSLPCFETFCGALAALLLAACFHVHLLHCIASKRLVCRLAHQAMQGGRICCFAGG